MRDEKTETGEGRKVAAGHLARWAALGPRASENPNRAWHLLTNSLNPPTPSPSERDRAGEQHILALRLGQAVSVSPPGFRRTGGKLGLKGLEGSSGSNILWLIIPKFPETLSIILGDGALAGLPARVCLAWWEWLGAGPLNPLEEVGCGNSVHC